MTDTKTVTTKLYWRGDFLMAGHVLIGSIDGALPNAWSLILNVRLSKKRFNDEEARGALFRAAEQAFARDSENLKNDV